MKSLSITFVLLGLNALFVTVTSAPVQLVDESQPTFKADQLEIESEYPSYESTFSNETDLHLSSKWNTTVYKRLAPPVRVPVPLVLPSKPRTSKGQTSSPGRTQPPSQKPTSAPPSQSQTNPCKRSSTTPGSSVCPGPAPAGGIPNDPPYTRCPTNTQLGYITKPPYRHALTIPIRGTIPPGQTITICWLRANWEESTTPLHVPTAAPFLTDQIRSHLTRVHPAFHTRLTTRSSLQSWEARKPQEEALLRDYLITGAAATELLSNFKHTGKTAFYLVIRGPAHRTTTLAGTVPGTEPPQKFVVPDHPHFTVNFGALDTKKPALSSHMYLLQDVPAGTLEAWSTDVTARTKVAFMAKKEGGRYVLNRSRVRNPRPEGDVVVFTQSKRV